MQKSNTGGSNVYPNFALDNVGCNGTESSLLDCLPQHNCGLNNRGAENAGVQCLRKGEHIVIVTANNKIFYSNIIIFTWPL